MARTAREWQTTFDATRDAIWILDQNHRILRTNKTAEGYFQHPCSGMMGQRCWEIVHDGATEPIPNCPFVRSRKSGHRETMDLQIGLGWFEVIVDPILDATGQFAGAVHIVSDITERKQAEEALRKSRTLYYSFVESLPIGIFRKDREGRFILVNPEFCRFKGMKAEEFLGKTPREVAAVEAAKQGAMGLATKYAANGTEHHEQIMQTGKPIDLVEEYIHADGGKQFLHVIKLPVVDHDGKIMGTQGIQFDITELKLAEERIREQAALLDAANDAIYVRSLDDVVTYWNDGAERLYGWTRAEALGRKIHDLIKYDRDAFETAREALLAQGNWSGELKMTDKTDKAVTVFCRWTLLRDESGRPKEVLAINTDITERKQLEVNFLRAQRMEGIGALAGGIAHDLNNILQPILMTAPFLRETTGDPESREMLNTVENCAQRGADIIKQLLTFARGQPSTRVPLPVRHLVNEMSKIIHETFPKNIQLRVNVPKDLWQVLGDATQIHQALMNLCVNARDAMPNGGTLTLSAGNLILDEAFAAMMPGAKPGPHVCVSVADTGMGIPPEHLDRIFDPFFTTKEIGKGTGLGLPTVLGIARGHGGFVRVKSQTGKGTIFELYLPASSEAKTAVSPERESLPPRAGGELILVVDDEADVRSVVRRTLEKHGYRVLTAAEGAEAMGLFAQHRAEVRAVITDMMMPDMDGPALVRTLRHLDPQLPILGMTGLGEKADIKGLETLDLLVLLTKPFNIAGLLGVLHQALAAPRKANGKS
jgi:PAS domain S-box-containing protein